MSVVAPLSDVCMSSREAVISSILFSVRNLSRRLEMSSSTRLWFVTCSVMRVTALSQRALFSSSVYVSMADAYAFAIAAAS